MLEAGSEYEVTLRPQLEEEAVKEEKEEAVEVRLKGPTTGNNNPPKHVLVEPDATKKLLKSPSKRPSSRGRVKFRVS